MIVSTFCVPTIRIRGKRCESAVFLCPTLVLLDEPSMGLAPIIIVQEIFEMKH